jgi:hypothetical protein
LVAPVTRMVLEDVLIKCSRKIIEFSGSARSFSDCPVARQAVSNVYVNYSYHCFEW